MDEDLVDFEFDLEEAESQLRQLAQQGAVPPADMVEYKMTRSTTIELPKHPAREKGKLVVSAYSEQSGLDSKVTVSVKGTPCNDDEWWKVHDLIKTMLGS